MKISTLQYAKTLLELTTGKSEQETSAIVEKFAVQLKNDGQMKHAAKITEKFSELYDTAHGIVKTEIVSRERLSDEMIGKISVFIKEKYSAKEVVVENIVDGRIQGGVIIKIGDEVMDGSVAAKLKKLKRVLSN